MKAAKVVGLILLVGVIVQAGSMMDNTFGNLITVFGAAAGVYGVVQVVRGKL